MIEFSKKPGTFIQEASVPRAKESKNCPKRSLAGAGIYSGKVLPTFHISLSIQYRPLPEAGLAGTFDPSWLFVRPSRISV